MGGRGEQTDAIAAKMSAFLGRDPLDYELRLYPYLLYVMVNEREIDPRKINRPEREVLSKLREEGHIEGGAGGMSITREFWTFAQDVMFDAYVAFDNEQEAD